MKENKKIERIAGGFCYEYDLCAPKSSRYTSIGIEALELTVLLLITPKTR